MTSKTYKSGKTWPVGAKKYAISAPSAAIALRYGKNVSKGIKVMEDVINAQQVMIEKFRPHGGGPSVRKLK